MALPREAQRSLRFNRRLRRSLLSGIILEPTPGRRLRSFGPPVSYLILQRQFEDDDGGVCYLETHDTDRFGGHFRLRLIEFTPTRLAFDIDRPYDRAVEVTYELSPERFREVQRIVHIIFGAGGAFRNEHDAGGRR